MQSPTELQQLLFTIWKPGLTVFSVYIYIYIYTFKILRGKTFDEFKVASSITNNHKLNFESVYNPIQVNEFLYTILIKMINISTLPRKE